MRSATFGFLWNCNCSTWFQSTHSLRSATNHQRGQPPRNSVSIHALLAECDHKRVHRSLYHLSFNPRTPCGVRPSCLYHRYLPHRFQSTHSLRSATPDCYFALYVLCVSIHALLAECDPHIMIIDIILDRFNPRTPCGVRPMTDGLAISTTLFQSTHSLRSATNKPRNNKLKRKVSIHALLAECDSRKPVEVHEKVGFNPRTPCGVRPVGSADGSYPGAVSIHALLAECDFSSSSPPIESTGFNPRTPCGVRRPRFWSCANRPEFQSTHSLRSATCAIVSAYRTRESFNPRTPCGVRPMPSITWRAVKMFQSTHSLRSAT